MASLEQVTPIPAERDSAPDDRPRTFRRSNWATVFLAGVHALAVVTFPWELVSRSGFSDFDTYVQTFTLLAPLYPISAVDWYEISTLLGLYTHEVLWFDGVMWLTSWSGDPVVALRLVSFAIVFVWGLYLFRSIPYLPAVLFLLNPASIDVALSGLRNGAAWGLIMCGLMVGVWVIRLPLFVISIFTHSTALPLLGFHYLANALGRRREGGRALVVMLSAGVVVGLALTVGNAWLLGAIGDRRIGESYVVGEGSLLQASLLATLGSSAPSVTDVSANPTWSARGRCCRRHCSQSCWFFSAQVTALTSGAICW